MKGSSHKLLQLKRHMKTREAGRWIAVTWQGSQWQEINTALPAPFFFFCCLGNYGTYIVLCRGCCIPAAYCGSLPWALQETSIWLAGCFGEPEEGTWALSMPRDKVMGLTLWVGAKFSPWASASGVILVLWGILPCLQLLIRKVRCHESPLPTLCRCLRYPRGTQRMLDTTLWQLSQTLDSNRNMDTCRYLSKSSWGPDPSPLARQRYRCFSSVFSLSLVC